MKHCVLDKKVCEILEDVEELIHIQVCRIEHKEKICMHTLLLNVAAL